jgi:hypothetical protein
LINVADIARVLLNVVPWRVRKYSRSRHREWAFRRAMWTFATRPIESLAGDADVLRRLTYGWGNEDWSAFPDYLKVCLAQIDGTRGPILECGSGLSTLLFGLVAQRTGNIVWTLEHNADWAQKVTDRLIEFGIDAVRLCVQPLRDYGDFSWYDPPLRSMPARFAGVVCDGPPGDTKGGRYGLLPVMRERLAPSAWILLDDAVRSEERAIASRWGAEFGATVEIRGTVRPYAALTMPPT